MLSMLTMLFSTIMLLMHMMMKSSFTNSFMNDSISMMMILTTIFIFCITNFMMSMKNNEYNSKMTNILLMIILLLFFSTSNMFLFFVAFELSLIPIFFMILLWGYQPERTQAGMFLALYTMTASFPLMASLILVYQSETTIFLNMNQYLSSPSMSSLMLLAFSLSFSIKLPIFFFHLWLPKAHVEAPTHGSMILAAILLKMGAYGIWRFWPLFTQNKIFFFLAMLSVMSFLIINMLCFTQTDTKCLIAYSSIVHMSLIIFCMYKKNMMSTFATLILLIAHAFISSAMFYLAGTMFYMKNSRSMETTKSMMMTSPALFFMTFFFLSANMAAPPTIGFFSEIMMMLNSIMINNSILLMMMLAMLLIGLYCIIFLMNNFTNNTNEMTQTYMMISPTQHLIFIFHIIPILLLSTKLPLMM